MGDDSVLLQLSRQTSFRGVLISGGKQHVPIYLYSCEWNIYNIKYALAISQQRGMKRPAEETPGDEEELDSDSDYLMQEAHKDN